MTDKITLNQMEEFGLHQLCVDLCKNIINSQVSDGSELRYLLPVKYIILTHGHLDHILGLPSLVEDNTDVISSEKAALVMDKDINWPGEYHFWARANQFGNAAEEYAIFCCYTGSGYGR